VVEALTEQGAKRYLVRDRDATYGHEFRRRIQSLGMKEVISAPRSPWQNAFAERIIGSIRRECLDHVVVLSQRHLRKLLKSYLLQPFADASGVGKGRPRIARDHESRRDRCHSSSRRLAPPV
jgi:transposase InsO family protein